ncbi:itaconate CoA-transferase [Ectothiorhodosinus mongolicus]|uniref:Itaconate CoA-transferase n=1 Tax=Ectothiorhodosinus mongolicus TaxID=233100 RepID=A0A1R3WBI4_9GAMM|nr:CaiB/BaiF CoA-transferase family protein [Ectothiorhodosinus mongolicus]ULX57700.1 CoA transferase [Ectothiorhodosinus mongolicus]SIT73670.1 itaconate CoA-transferase [Ectothiorhodosinus mongolicus]
MNKNTHPLSGLLVVALEHAIAAPFCTRQLADLGARVIKIERPKHGDFARNYDDRVKGISSHFAWTNRSKESLTLDIKTPEGKDILMSLLAKADVFVQNLAPGATQRLGLSYETLKNSNDQLIVCDISGYGDSGPYRDKKAYDLLIQSESGFLSITGTPDEPSKAGCSIADIAAGMYAYSNILAALIKRGLTQSGCRIEVSMLESMVEWMGYPLYYAFEGAEPPERAGASHATIYPYGLFSGNDQGTIVLGLQNEKEWALFCNEVLKKPHLLSDERFKTNSARSEHRSLLKKLIDDVFAQYSADEIVTLLDKAGIACARVNTLNEVWDHPQLTARNRWTQIGSPSGALPALLPPGIDSADHANMGPIPGLGQHSRTILTELAYSDEQIQTLEDNGII